MILIIALVIMFGVLTDEDRIVSFFGFLSYFFIRIGSKILCAAASKETMMEEICREVIIARVIKVENSDNDLVRS
jgi:hypothetical protein